MKRWPSQEELWGDDWMQRADEKMAARRRQIALEKQQMAEEESPARGSGVASGSGGRWISGSMRTVYGAKLALGDPPPVNFIVPGLFTAPSLNLLVGDPGHKKSLLAIDLAISVAMGKPWLGLPITQVPTLLVEEETNLLRLWKRLHSALVAHQATQETPFHFISMGQYDFRQPSEAQDLIEHTKALGARLIIIDALADVMVGGDENSTLSMGPIFRHLRSVAFDTSAAVVIIHHTNKSGFFRGSSSIAAGVDHMLSVYSPPGQPFIRVSTVKSRDVDAVTFHAEAHFENDLFWLTPASEDQMLAPLLSHTKRRILAFVAANPECITHHVHAALADLSLAAVRKALRDLTIDNFLTRTDGGAQGSKASYMVTEQAESELSQPHVPIRQDP